MKTHKILDLHYTPEEGQTCFSGTLQECNTFLETQTPCFMYKIVPLTKEEIKIYSDIK